mmetsp:Transcript_6510/g.27750  ORF Transcript_6510/g.27750 Transcript_6510/m.27750 type:complete len:233 (+) Transcript_6510:1075-1773(+)
MFARRKQRRQTSHLSRSEKSSSWVVLQKNRAMKKPFASLAAAAGARAHRLILHALRLVVLALEHVAPLLDHAVDQAVLDGLRGREVPPPVQVHLHLLHGLSRKLAHEPHVRVLAHLDLVRADLHVHGRVERAVELGRVRHDLRVRKRVPAPLVPGREQHRGIPEALPNRHRVDLGADVAHRVEDGVRLRVDAHRLALFVDRPAGVNVDVPGAVVLLIVQKQKLRDDQLRHRR